VNEYAGELEVIYNAGSVRSIASGPRGLSILSASWDRAGIAVAVEIVGSIVIVGSCAACAAPPILQARLARRSITSEIKIEVFSFYPFQ